MKQILSGNLLIITPEEGYSLALRGNISEGNFSSKMMVPKDSPIIEKIIEVPYTENSVYVPEYTQVQKDMSLAELQKNIIQQTKVILENYLTAHPYFFKDKFYNVSTEAQTHLLSMIKAGEMSKELGLNFQLKWSAIGEIQMEWTLEDLKLLFVNIQSYVNKFVIQQQKKEQEILSIASKEELINLDLSYHD